MLTKKKVEFQQLSRIVDLGVFLSPQASSSGLRSAVVDGEGLDAPPPSRLPSLTPSLVQSQYADRHAGGM